MLIFITLSFLSFAEIFLFFPLAFVYFASNNKYEFVFKNSTSRRLETNKKGVKTSAACDNKSEKKKLREGMKQERRFLFACVYHKWIFLFYGGGGKYFFLNKK